jgi:lipooligosaccharide transport system permease protein
MSAHPDITRRAWTVWYRNFLVWRVYFWAGLVGDIVEPLLYLFAMGLGLGMLVPDVGGVSYIAFIAPGIICSSAMYAATFECTFGAYTRMSRQGTYDAILATPVSLDEVVAGEVLWGATKSAFSCLAMLAVMLPAGLLSSPWTLLALPVAFLTGLLFASAAMLVTAWCRGYDFFSYYFTLVISPMFLFSGIFFPVESLPSWAQKASWALPLTHAVGLNRSLFSGLAGASVPGALVDLAWLAAATLALFLLALRGVRRRMVL